MDIEVKTVVMIPSPDVESVKIALDESDEIATKELDDKNAELISSENQFITLYGKAFVVTKYKGIIPNTKRKVRKI
jgi:hypothetical protein